MEGLLNGLVQNVLSKIDPNERRMLCSHLKAGKIHAVDFWLAMEDVDLVGFTDHDFD